jgi:hypothetical protein
MNKYLLTALALLGTLTGASADNVSTYHNSIYRTGAYKIPSLTLAASQGVHLDTAFKPKSSRETFTRSLCFMRPSGSPAKAL